MCGWWVQNGERRLAGKCASKTKQHSKMSLLHCLFWLSDCLSPNSFLTSFDTTLPDFTVLFASSLPSGYSPRSWPWCSRSSEDTLPSFASCHCAALCSVLYLDWTVWTALPDPSWLFSTMAPYVLFSASCTLSHFSHPAPVSLPSVLGLGYVISPAVPQPGCVTALFLWAVTVSITTWPLTAPRGWAQVGSPTFPSTKPGTEGTSVTLHRPGLQTSFQGPLEDVPT